MGFESKDNNKTNKLPNTTYICKQNLFGNVELLVIIICYSQDCVVFVSSELTVTLAITPVTPAPFLDEDVKAQILRLSVPISTISLGPTQYALSSPLRQNPNPAVRPEF